MKKEIKETAKETIPKVSSLGQGGLNQYPCLEFIPFSPELMRKVRFDINKLWIVKSNFQMPKKTYCS